jgi:hypothetical protein
MFHTTHARTNTSARTSGFECRESPTPNWHRRIGGRGEFGEPNGSQTDRIRAMVLEPRTNGQGWQPFTSADFELFLIRIPRVGKPARF